MKSGGQQTSQGRAQREGQSGPDTPSPFYLQIFFVNFTLRTPKSVSCAHHCFMTMVIQMGQETILLTLVLLNCLLLFFIHSKLNERKLESLTQFPASNDDKYFHFLKNRHIKNWVVSLIRQCTCTVHACERGGAGCKH